MEKKVINITETRCPGHTVNPDYIGWHNFSDEQEARGRYQMLCGFCGRWYYECEMGNVPTENQLAPWPYYQQNPFNDPAWRLSKLLSFSPSR
jgi:hypothetical protein